MSFEMTIECRFDCECSWADVTSERLFTCMYTDVAHKITWLLKTLWTVFTLMGVLLTGL